MAEFNLTIYIILLFFSLFLLRRNQRETPYVRIGWFFVILTFFYLGFPFLCGMFIPAYLKSTLKTHYSAEFLFQFSQILIYAQLSFVIAEVLTSPRNSFPTTRSQFFPVNTKIIFILLCISYVMFFLRWESVGGFTEILRHSRRDYMNDVSEEAGILTRFDIILTIVGLFLAYNLALRPKFFRENKIVCIGFLLHLLLTILMGTRLIVMNVLIGTFAVFYLLNKNILIKNKKKILTAGFLASFFLVIFQTLRTDIMIYFASNRFYIQKDKLTLLPLEFFTGFLAEYNLTQGMYLEPQMSFIERLLPSSVNNLLGLTNYPTFATEIADKSAYSSGIVTYTVPYAIDLYHSLNNNFFLLVIVSAIIYLSFDALLRFFYRTNIFYLLVIYFLIYFVLRAETAIWFSRFYLSFIVLFLLFIFDGRSKRALKTYNF